MHTTATRLIAAHAGLPSSHAPFLPEITFPAVNLGGPAVGALAVHGGCSPEAAVLAVEHLAFCGALLSVYLLLRLCVRPTAAAVLALFGVWGSRSIQEVSYWGGFPTVLSLALGLLAARLLILVARRPSTGRGLVLGLIVGALPLVHGVGAAIWLYVVAPVAGGVTLLRCRRIRAAWPAMLTAALVAGGVVFVYLGAGQPGLSPTTRDWIRECQAGYAPRSEGWLLPLETFHKHAVFGGRVAVLLGSLGLGVLLLQRRLAALAVAGGALALLLLILVNSRFWILPGSLLLYPDRASMWAAPLAALTLALAWRSWPRRWALAPTVSRGLALGLLGIALFLHGRSYQKFACRPLVSRGEWEALQWAERNLDPQRSLVAGQYHTAGAYLPGVAGIASSGAHHHIFLEHDVHELMARRNRTHHFHCKRWDGSMAPTGRVVFENEAVVIQELQPEKSVRR